jgi:hypothetical protein
MSVEGVAVREAWAEPAVHDEGEQEIPYVFRKRQGRLDWKLLSSVDPDTVARRGDVVALQAVVDNLTFADVELEGFQERNLVKLLRLSQLAVEYVVHSQVTPMEQPRRTPHRHNRTDPPGETSHPLLSQAPYTANPEPWNLNPNRRSFSSGRRAAQSQIRHGTLPMPTTRARP